MELESEERGKEKESEVRMKVGRYGQRRRGAKEGAITELATTARASSLRSSTCPSIILSSNK
jgi:hypothetical protein